MPKIDVQYVPEEGIPIPVGREKSVPLAELEIGQSYLVPLEQRNTVQANASRLKARTGKVFTIQKIDEYSIRVWRKA